MWSTFWVEGRSSDLLCVAVDLESVWNAGYSELLLHTELLSLREIYQYLADEAHTVESFAAKDNVV